MLLIIHNLPQDIRPNEVKKLIQEKCNLGEVILDNFTNEGGYKRVTVGLADEGDAALLVRQINGLYYRGQQLFVEDVRKKKMSDQPFRPSGMQNVMMDGNAHFNKQIVPPLPQPPAPPMAYSNLPFYMSPAQTSYPNYGSQAPAVTQELVQVAYYQQDGLNSGYQKPNLEKHWQEQAIVSYPGTLEMPSPAYHDTSNSLKERSSGPQRSYSNDRKNDNSPSRRSYNRDDDRTERSRGRERERYERRTSPGNKRRRQDLDERFRRHSSPRRRNFEDNRYSNRENKRYGDNENRKRTSRLDRSPPRDREFCGRGNRDRMSDQRELHRQSENVDRYRDYHKRDRSFERDDDSRGYKERDSNWESSNRYENIDDHNKQPRAYDQNKEPYGYGHGDVATKVPYQEPEQIKNFNRTYSNHPGNSTFSKSNERYDDKPSTKNDTLPQRNESFSEPLSKRPKFNQEKPFPSFDNQNKKSGNPKTFEGVIKTQPNVPLHKLISRHMAWRAQTAARVGKEAIIKSNAVEMENYSAVYKKIKECIASRIDVIVGDHIVNSLPEMLQCYRSKFDLNDDAILFKAVVEKVERDQKEAEVIAEAAQNAETAPAEENATAPGFSGLMPPPTTIPKVRPPVNTNIRPAASPLQNRPSAPFQSRPGAPMTQNRPAGSFIQNRPLGPPNNNNRPATPFNQNRPPGPTRFNRPSGPISYNKASAPLNQMRPSAPINANRPSAPKQFQKKALSAGQNTVPQLAKFTDKLHKETSGKDICKLNKKIHKMEFEKDDLYTIDPIRKEAIDSEMKLIRECFVSPCQKAFDPVDVKISRRIRDECADRFYKIVNLQVTKRLLGITTGLVLRIFLESGKLTHLAMNLLKTKFGLMSIKKFDKMMVATCTSYLSYDTLLTAGALSFGGCKFSFKPMHIAGPPLSVRQKIKLKQERESRMKISGVEENSFEDPNPNIDENLDDVNIDAGEDSDIIIVENDKQNVVLVEDDDVREENLKSNDESEPNKAKICVVELDNEKTETNYEANIDLENTTVEVGDPKDFFENKTDNIKEDEDRDGRQSAETVIIESQNTTIDNLEIKEVIRNEEIVINNEEAEINNEEPQINNEKTEIYTEQANNDMKNTVDEVPDSIHLDDDNTNENLKEGAQPTESVNIDSLHPIDDIADDDLEDF